ncbi:prephenate dehydrogenase [Pseudalkalibacillus caeni]|uniref:Prephenate dehydrogenase n=1 Tax=Exobacillus caeni TaxID=2574798 RepID=A0A5R9F5Z9_9BACL|nr:prephenate dehydrogenase [Pseudalkalibacillus caeni]TLS35904.1 prephenate dehydrogenase [Pseudalkalibacillus caeni]
MEKNTVLLIGLGLIGGSIALGIKRKHEKCRIIGYDLNENQLKLAETLKVIDESSTDLASSATEADLIVIATPVVQTENIIDQLMGLQLKKNVIITDVGSTKKKVVDIARNKLGGKAVFIGGHPMAGSHKSGVTAARAHLFENAFYLLVPAEGENSSDSVEKLKGWLEGTGAVFVVMDEKEHDRLVGIISHFPHVLAASLVNYVADEDQAKGTLSRFAAGGFRDITRIASSSPEMWRDILLHNREVLLSLLDQWDEELGKIKELIKDENSQGILDYFTRSKQFRDRLPGRSKGAIPSFYDLYVDVEDEPGVIASITKLLAEEKISITNIRIIETREDIMGVLRVSFRSETDRQEAQKKLGPYYETYLDK